MTVETIHNDDMSDINAKSFGKETGSFTAHLAEGWFHMPGFLLGRDSPFVMGRDDFVDLLPVVDRLGLEKALQASYEDGSPFNIIVPVHSEGQDERYIQFHAEKTTGDPQLFSGVVHDVTRSHLHARALTDLHNLTSRPGLKFRSKIEQILELGLKYFNLDLAIVSRIEQETYTVLHVRSDLDLIQEGAVLELGLTYCWHTLQARSPIGFDHVGQSRIRTHPCYTTAGLEAYIGAPLIVHGKVYGTINFSSHNPSRPFDKLDMDLVHLFSQWAGFEIERHLDTEQLEKEVKRAQIAERAKNTFMANVSHEMRTPLNAIRGFAQLLDSELESDRHLQRTQHIIRSTDTLNETFDRILELQKYADGVEKLEPTALDLNHLLKQLSNKRSTEAAQKNVELFFEFASNCPRWAMAHEKYLLRILDILLENGIKFTDSGYVKICLRKASDPEYGPVLHWTIEDSGIGIPEDQLDTIFNAFAQKDDSFTRRHGGLGLGLSVCKALVPLIKGRLWVESKLGQGSQFHLFVPWVAADGEDDDLILPMPSFQGLNIVYITPTEAMGRTVATFLSECGSAVHRPHSVQDALSHVAGLTEPLNTLVLLDNKLPDGSGLDLVHKINALSHGPSVKIILRSDPSETPMLRTQTKHMKNVLILQTPSTPEDWRHVDSWIRLTNMALSAANTQDPPSDVTTEQPLQAHGTTAQESQKTVSADFVLLVDDSMTNRMVGQEILRASGVYVETANNGKEAVDLVCASPEKYKLVFLDLIMPVMDGLEAATVIRKRLGKTAPPLIALTGHSDAKISDKCQQAGMEDCLTKPMNTEHVHALIQKYAINILGNKEHQVAPPTSAPEQPNPEPATLDTDVTLEDLLQKLPSYDVEASVARVANNTKLFVNLLSHFVKDFKDDHESIANSVRENNIDLAKRETHTLKGAAANLGINSLARAAAHLEQALESGVDVSLALDILARNFASAISEAESVIGASQNSHAADETIIEATIEEVTAELEALKLLLQSMDMSAEEKSHALAPKLRKYFPDQTRELLTNVDSLDYDTSITIIDSVLMRI